jgi:hypothetical protein
MSFALVATAQNMLYLEIQQAKENNISFTTLPNFFKKTGNVFKFESYFINPQEVSWFEYTPANLENQWAISLTIPKNEEAIVVELIEAPDICYQYDVVTSDGKVYPANRDIKHYRGIVKDNPNSLVAMTFFKGEMMGMIATEEGNFNLGKCDILFSVILHSNFLNSKII